MRGIACFARQIVPTNDIGNKAQVHPATSPEGLNGSLGLAKIRIS